ncbi:hypothetical protein I0P70_07075 [Pontibacter sp. FD36]|uniref:hypothetical protein n=1 Tax=Pontibacter sp. FD36 TaxID=2789860 RepID=UPI0018AC3B76|nr:hypothetical protein [Pontibacter sp. FD36]MBF8963000.1 hypothetical protein [Pontibacter sp. FD36]
MEMNSYQNPMVYDTEIEAYRLKIPNDLIINTENCDHKVTVIECISREHDVFDCITSYEDYDYVMSEYIKKTGSSPKPTAGVLILYYDEVLRLHVTLAVKVSISRVEYEAFADVPSTMNRKVKTFQDWQMDS